MATKTQATLAEYFFRKTLSRFDRISEEDSTEYLPPADQAYELLKDRKEFDKSFVFQQIEGKTYYVFFLDGSWLVFDDTDKTQVGACLKDEEIDSSLLPPNYSAKYNGKVWEINGR